MRQPLGEVLEVFTTNQVMRSHNQQELLTVIEVKALTIPNHICQESSFTFRMNPDRLQDIQICIFIKYTYRTTVEWFLLQRREDA
jgi:hypothetical protein